MLLGHANDVRDEAIGDSNEKESQLKGQELSKGRK